MLFALLVLLPGVMLAPIWRLAALGASEDDVLYYAPARVLINQLWHAGQPLWLNPYNGLDRALLADPQMAIFYPSTWLSVIFDPLAGYGASFWLHYSLALLGAYRLLRSQALDRRASLTGALIFAFGGFLLGHRAHLTITQSAAWAPWIFLLVRNAYLRPLAAWRHALLALGIAAQLLAGHLQIAVISCLGAGIYVLAEAGWRTRRVLCLVASGVMGLCVAAIQIIPTMHYVAASTRGQRTITDFLENSWSPYSLIQWAAPLLVGQRVPNFFSEPYWGPSHQSEQFVYAGVAALILIIVAFRVGWRRSPEQRAWVILGVIALLAALGMYGPIYPPLYFMPGASIFRVPARMMLLAQLAAAALTAGIMHELARPLSPAGARVRYKLLHTLRRVDWFLLAGGAVIVWVLIAVALLPSPERAAAAMRSLTPWRPPMLVTVGLVAVSWLTLRFVAVGWQHPRRLWLIPMVLALDLGVMGWTIDSPRGVDRPEQLLYTSQARDLSERVHAAPGRLWVITPRAFTEATPGEYIESTRKMVSNVNLLYAVASLTDYGPIMPKAYTRLLPFKAWGELLQPGINLLRHDWRRVFNVRWLLLCDPNLPVPDGATLEHVYPSGDRLIYNPDAGGLAMFENAAVGGVVAIEEASPTRMQLRVAPRSSDAQPTATTREPGFRLLISRLALPGWSAWVNGVPTPVTTADSGLIALEVPKKSVSTVTLIYYPPGLRAGAAVSAAALALCIALLLFRERPVAQPQPPTAPAASLG